jgi:hypothetical protein
MEEAGRVAGVQSHTSYHAPSIYQWFLISQPGG